MNVELQPAGKSDREVIRRLFQLYLYDMSEYMGWAVNADGQFDFSSSILDPYWTRDDHHPFLISCDGELAGFSLLRRSYFSSRGKCGHWAPRRKGTGSGAAGGRACPLSSANVRSI